MLRAFRRRTTEVEVELLQFIFPGQRSPTQGHPAVAFVDGKRRRMSIVCERANHPPVSITVNEAQLWHLARPFEVSDVDRRLVTTFASRRHVFPVSRAVYCYKEEHPMRMAHDHGELIGQDNQCEPITRKQVTVSRIACKVVRILFDCVTFCGLVLCSKWRDKFGNITPSY